LPVFIKLLGIKIKITISSIFPNYDVINNLRILLRGVAQGVVNLQPISGPEGFGFLGMSGRGKREKIREKGTVESKEIRNKKQ
jgi:hypothetical protein